MVDETFGWSISEKNWNIERDYNSIKVIDITELEIKFRKQIIVIKNSIVH